MNTPDFAEQDFYLGEFRRKSLLFALRAADLGTDTAEETAVSVFGSLLLNRTRVLLIIETSGAEGEQRHIKALSNRLGRMAKLPAVAPTALPTDGSEDRLLAQIWAGLRMTPLFIGLWPANPPRSLVACAQRIAVRLKLYKLILLDPAGADSSLS